MSNCYKLKVKRYLHSKKVSSHERVLIFNEFVAVEVDGGAQEHHHHKIVCISGSNEHVLGEPFLHVIVNCGDNLLQEHNVSFFTKKITLFQWKKWILIRDTLEFTNEIKTYIQAEDKPSKFFLLSNGSHNVSFFTKKVKHMLLKTVSLIGWSMMKVNVYLLSSKNLFFDLKLRSLEDELF